jgi:hypothetical protein
MPNYTPKVPGLGLSRRAGTDSNPSLGIAKPSELGASPNMPDPFGPDPLSDFSGSRKFWTGLADWAATTRGEPTASERIIAGRQRQVLEARKAEMEAADKVQEDMDKKLSLIQELPEDQRDVFIAKYADTYEQQQPGTGDLFFGIAKHRQANAITLDEAIKLDPEVSAAYATGGADEALKVLGKEQTLRRLAWLGNEKLLPKTIQKGKDGIKWLTKNDPKTLNAVVGSDQELSFSEFEQLNARLPEQLRLDYRELGVASSEPRFYESFGMTPPSYVTDRKQILDDAMIKAQVDERFRIPGIVTLENIETGKPRAFTDRQAADIVTKEPGKWAEVQTQRVGAANDLPGTTKATIEGERAKINETETSLNDLKQIVTDDPAASGLTHTIAGLAQDTGASARAMGEWLTKMQTQVAANPVLGPDGKPSKKYPLSYYYDQNIPVAEAIARLIPYQMAGAFAGQTGRGLSDNDVQRFEGVLGANEILANPQSVPTRIDYFLGRLPELRKGLAVRLGDSADDDLSKYDFGELLTHAMKYKSDAPRALKIARKRFPDEYAKWKKERQAGMRR